MFTLKNNSVICFMGDSVTDCGRDYRDIGDLGQSYVKKIQSYLSTFHAGLNVKLINKGINGNRVCDLQKRWDADCLSFEPDVVTILIGINETWRRFDGGGTTDVQVFEAGYRDILRKTQLTGAEIIILEPFVLPFPQDRLAWRADLDPRIQSVRKLAREFHATFIPLDGIFASLITQSLPETYALDGVHPTDAGHTVIAREWLGAANLL